MTVDQNHSNNGAESRDLSNEPVYLKHFGFSEAPFSIAPDPHYLYMTQQHQEALAHLLYGIRSAGGFVLLTGEVGTGKTTVCRCFMEQLPDHCDVAFIINPRLNPRELLLTICEELLVFPAFLNRPSTKELVDRINSHLLQSHGSGRSTVLIIDEAQNLSLEVLEQMRLLTNLETNKRKLLQIIMIGQPELRDILNQPEVRQLAQRITARYHLGPLSAEETAEYIRHRLTVAGCRQPIFAASAIRRIHRLSQGIPRIINVLCDRALLGAYVEGRESVDAAVVKRAAREVFGASRMPGGHRRGWWAAGLSLLLVLVLFGGAYLATRLMTPWEIKLSPWSRGSRVERAAAVTGGARGATRVGKHLQDRSPSGSGAPSLPADQSAPPERPKTAKEPQAVKASARARPEPVAKETAARGAKAGPGQPVAAKIEWQAELPAQQSRLLAFRSIFARWGVPGATGERFDVCTRAGIEGLQCLVGQGSWTDLVHFNRPCVLTMNDSRGKIYYVALMKVDGDRVICVKDGKRLAASRDQIEKRWNGEFAMLWKPPPAYQREVRQGDSGPVVAWLASRLSLLFHQTVAMDEGTRFGESLSAAVKRFQAENGLAADGIVGPQTLIEINNRTERLVPRLVLQGRGSRDVLHSESP